MSAMSEISKALCTLPQIRDESFCASGKKWEDITEDERRSFCEKFAETKQRNLGLCLEISPSAKKWILVAKVTGEVPSVDEIYNVLRKEDRGYSMELYQMLEPNIRERAKALHDVFSNPLERDVDGALYSRDIEAHLTKICPTQDPQDIQKQEKVCEQYPPTIFSRTKEFINTHKKGVVAAIAAVSTLLIGGAILAIVLGRRGGKDDDDKGGGGAAAATTPETAADGSTAPATDEPEVKADTTVPPPLPETPEADAAGAADVDDMLPDADRVNSQKGLHVPTLQFPPTAPMEATDTVQALLDELVQTRLSVFLPELTKIITSVAASLRRGVLTPEEEGSMQRYSELKEEFVNGLNGILAVVNFESTNSVRIFVERNVPWMTSLGAALNLVIEKGSEAQLAAVISLGTFDLTTANGILKAAIWENLSSIMLGFTPKVSISTLENDVAVPEAHQRMILDILARFIEASALSRTDEISVGLSVKDGSLKTTLEFKNSNVSFSVIPNEDGSLVNLSYPLADGPTAAPFNEEVFVPGGDIRLNTQDSTLEILLALQGSPSDSTPASPIIFSAVETEDASPELENAAAAEEASADTLADVSLETLSGVGSQGLKVAGN